MTKQTTVVVIGSLRVKLCKRVLCALIIQIFKHFQAINLLKLFVFIWTFIFKCATSVDSRYLEDQWTIWNTSRYPYLNISDLQIWGKNKSNNHISQMMKFEIHC